MKEKLLAIIRADTDEDTKVEWIEGLIEKYEDKKLMEISNEYLEFMSDRNQLLLDTVGLNGLEADVKYVSPSELWNRFKDYLTEKENAQSNGRT
jgi:hypothetical protein